MRCGARGSGSMAGEAVASVLKEEEDARWAKWAKRLNRPTGQLGLVGSKGQISRQGCWADWAKI
jgi:hypothetical protein